MPEANIVYLHPDGLDVGTCERSAPCQRIQFGATKASLNRNHIVLIAGQYDLGAQTEYITSQTTLAPKLFIHGGGSVIHTTAEVGVITTYVDAVIRDLEIVGNGEGLLIGTPGPSVLERVKIRGPNAQGIVVNSDVTMRDISIEDAGFAILLQGAARLTLDRGSIRNPYVGISSNANTVIVNITNLLVFGATNMAFDLTFSAGGTVNFTTIADSGTDAGSGPRAFKCGVSGPIIRSSIIWAPGTVARPAIDSGCTLISTIVGPTAVPGATNVDPLFVNAAVRDYHLSAGSPARDMVDSGPALDFEGDPRPRGARFDIGADEAP